MAGRTVATCFRDTVAARPEARWPCAGGTATAWGELDLGRVRRPGLSRSPPALSDLGVVRGERVVLMMRNRPEFHVADLATLLVGATPVSIYNSSAPEQIQYLVRHSGAVVAIVEDVDYLERLLKVRDELPCLEHVVVIDDDGRAPDGVLRFETLCGAAPVDLDAAAGHRAARRPRDRHLHVGDDRAAEGRDARPHQHRVDHREHAARVRASIDPTGSRTVSYLPMAHIAERMMSHYQGIGFGYEVTTCPEPSLLASYLPEARPQIMFAVPRGLGEAPRRVCSRSPRRTPSSAAALDAALAVGEREQACRARGEAMPRDLAASTRRTRRRWRSCARCSASTSSSRRSAARRRSPARCSCSSAPSGSSSPRSTGSPRRRGP